MKLVGAAALVATLGLAVVAFGEEVVDGIAAQVGTEVVLISDVARMSDPVEKKMRAAGATDQDVAEMRAEALEQMIEHKMIALLAKRAEIEASEAEIDDAIASVAKENGMTTEALKKSVESQGLPWEAYRKKLGEEIVQQKVVGGMVRAKVEVKEDEVRALYQQRYGDQPTGGREIHVLQIAQAADGEKPAQHAAACERVRAALGRVRAGESFAKVAAETSQAAPDFGWIHEATLAPWMVAVLAKLNPGQVSDTIELPVGCAALQLVGTREAQPVSYEQAEKELRAMLYDERFQEQYRHFIEKLRKQTYVDRKGVFADATRIGAKAPGAGEAPRLQ
jgi:peptidyl-prolyl cis-trans isomerase SurA